MRDILTTLASWHDAGVPAAIATVVETQISAPRDPGAAMAVNADGVVVGSVSGGCVEGAVVEQCQEVLAGGPARQVTYGVSDDEAVAVGLTCGGEISLFVEPFAIPGFAEVRRLIEDGRGVAIGTVVDGPGNVGSKLVVTEDAQDGDLGSEGLAVAVSSDARGMLAQGRTGRRSYGADGERRVDDVTVFVQSFQPPPRMDVFGAIDFAAAVARIGKFLGYHVTVCDARRVFATRARFPDADEVVVQWPHRFLPTAPVDARTVLCVLTHDPKFDVPLLEGEDGLEVLFTLRPADLPSHGGQVSFPGGRVAGGDENPWATALRESEEELGVDPAGIERLGVIDDYQTITHYHVTPCVGLLRRGTRMPWLGGGLNIVSSPRV